MLLSMPKIKRRTLPHNSSHISKNPDEKKIMWTTEAHHWLAGVSTKKQTTDSQKTSTTRPTATDACAWAKAPRCGSLEAKAP